MFGDIVGWHQRLGGGGGCYWHLMSRGRDVLQHPTVGRVAPYEQRIIPFKMLMDGEKERPARESAEEDFLPEKKKKKRPIRKLAQLLPKLNTFLLCHTSENLDEFLFQPVGWVFCLFGRLSGRGRMCHGQRSVVHSAS